jgi:hypothetical protein
MANWGKNLRVKQVSIVIEYNPNNRYRTGTYSLVIPGAMSASEMLGNLS